MTEPPITANDGSSALNLIAGNKNAVDPDEFRTIDGCSYMADDTVACGTRRMQNTQECALLIAPTSPPISMFDRSGYAHSVLQTGQSCESATESEPLIHETAIVEEGARIGPGTRVWHHCQVRRGASIGTGCVLGKGVFVDADVQIGNGVKIQNNVSVYAGVSLEDDVFVGPSAVFTNDLYPRASNLSWEVSLTKVRMGASIGANATIVCGVDIGAWATIAAGSVVTRDVEPHALVMGHPARRVGWVCRCGRVLARTTGPISTDPCQACGRSNPDATS